MALALLPVGCGGGSLSGQEQVSFVTVDTDPDWSPDGRLIAFASSRNSGGIYVIHPDGSGLRRVFRGPASNVDWSPDGRQIAFQDRAHLRTGLERRAAEACPTGQWVLAPRVVAEWA